MTVFRTPEPISVALEFGIGNLCLVASETNETVIEVVPTDPENDRDVNAAKQIRVEYASGSLLVRGQKNWRQWAPWGPWGGGDSIDVEIRLPEGSRVSAEVAMASVRSSGRLGEVDIKTGMGDVRVEHARSTKIRTGFGEVILGRVDGDAEVKTGSGRVDIDSVNGSVTVKNSNGETRVGAVEGRAQLQNANGTIEVDSAHSDVTAKTAAGDIRVGRLSRGATEAKTACGQIDIGVLDGVAAWLELSTGFGRVNNELEIAGRPSAGEQTVEIRAHTFAGDINVRRISARAEVGTSS